MLTASDSVTQTFEISNFTSHDEKSGITLTTITLFDDVGYYEATGSSRCMEPDKFNVATGMTLSLGRALKDLGHKLCSEAYGEVHYNDKNREKQEIATEAGRNKAFVAKKDFEERLAQLIEELHPGTF